MPAQDKEMGTADFENFLRGQFPYDSEKVNSLLEQISASKVRMEDRLREDFGDDINEGIPSFYSTVSRLIEANSANGISDWVNSNGQVNLGRINKVAEIAKKEFEVKKIQEQEAEQTKQKREQIETEYENTIEKDIKEKLNTIDFDNMTTDDWAFVSENMEAVLDNATYEDLSKMVDGTQKATGAKDEFSRRLKVVLKVYKGEGLTQEDQEILENMTSEEREMFGYDLDQKAITDEGKIVKIFQDYTEILANIKKLNPLNKENLEKFFSKEDVQAFVKRFPNAFDLDKILESSEQQLEENIEPIQKQFDDILGQGYQNQFSESKYTIKDVEDVPSALDFMFDSTFEGMDDLAFDLDKILESRKQQVEDNIEPIQKQFDDVLGQGYQNQFSESKYTIKDVEDAPSALDSMFDSMFEGMDDLAFDLEEQAEELGLPMQEGDGYTTFFEIEEGQQERGQDGIDGQEFGEADEIARGQADEVAEIVQQGEDRVGEEPIQNVARDTLEQVVGDNEGKKVSPNAMGVVGMFRDMAEGNDDIKGQEDTYQSPTLDNLEDNKKGGILGFFSKIKEAVQARFAKKSEQKMLNPSNEQRTDKTGGIKTNISRETTENGLQITTVEPKGRLANVFEFSPRRAMVRFAENTIGRISKLTTNAPRSSEPINTPYVIPTNVQKREDKQRDEGTNKSWDLSDKEREEFEMKSQARTLNGVGNPDRNRSTTIDRDIEDR